MTKTVKSMMEDANGAVPRIAPAEVAALMAERGAVLVDVRETAEVEASGLVPGAIHIPRGMIEFRADAATPYHDERLSPEKPVVLYCASGGRSALAGRTLQEMGYREVYNLGSYKDYVAATTETPGEEPR